MKKIAIILVIFSLSIINSAAFASFTPLPITNVDSVALIDKCNVLLSVLNRGYQCTRPEAFKVRPNEIMYRSYVGRKTASDPMNGAIIILENISDHDVMCVFVVQNQNDNVLSHRGGEVMAAIAFSCGLTTEELSHLSDQVTHTKIGSGTVWSSKNKIYYTMKIQPNLIEQHSAVVLVAHNQ